MNTYRDGDVVIRNHLRRLRFEHGELTQEGLAKRCGVTRQTVIALEAGRYLPSLELAFKLARTFGVGVEDVFEAESSPARAANTEG